MTPPPVVVRTLAGVAIASALAALWLAHDNPEIDDTSRGDDYTCLAPWDTVRNDAANFPGGEPPPDGDEMRRRCREAGVRCFNFALIGAAAAVVIATAGVATSWRLKRRAT